MAIMSLKLIVALLTEKMGKPKAHPKFWRPGKPVCVTKYDYGRALNVWERDTGLAHPTK